LERGRPCFERQLEADGGHASPPPAAGSENTTPTHLCFYNPVSVWQHTQKVDKITATLYNITTLQ